MGLERVIIDTGKPGASPVGSAIWMHGFGTDAHDFEPAIPMLDLAVPLRFVFPNAPLRPTTISGGAKFRTWYDINPQAPVAAAGEFKASPIVAVFRENIEKGDPIYRRINKVIKDIVKTFHSLFLKIVPCMASKYNGWKKKLSR